MSAVAQPTEGVNTLAAWLIAYLATPEADAKECFTLPELLEAAGMTSTIRNAHAMTGAMRRAGLIQQRRRSDGAILRTWSRARPVITHQTCGMDAFLPGHTEGDRRFTVFDPGAPEGDATVLCQACHDKGRWRYELTELTKFTAPDADTIRDWITQNTASVCDQVATCTGCGCTDDRACLGSCWWLAVDREAGKGVCSNCEDHLQAFLDQQEVAARFDAQEAQAQQRLAAFIDNAAEWSLMAYRIETRDIRDRADEAIARHRRVVKAVMRRLDPGTTGDPAPRILHIGGGLFDAFDRAPTRGARP